MVSPIFTANHPQLDIEIPAFPGQEFGASVQRPENYRKSRDATGLTFVHSDPVAEVLASAANVDTRDHSLLTLSAYEPGFHIRTIGAAIVASEEISLDRYHAYDRLHLRQIAFDPSCAGQIRKCADVLLSTVVRNQIGTATGRRGLDMLFDIDSSDMPAELANILEECQRGGITHKVDSKDALWLKGNALNLHGISDTNVAERVSEMEQSAEFGKHHGPVYLNGDCDRGKHGTARVYVAGQHVGSFVSKFTILGGKTQECTARATDGTEIAGFSLRHWPPYPRIDLHDIAMLAIMNSAPTQTATDGNFHWR